jgi:hypothetical protein
MTSLRRARLEGECIGRIRSLTGLLHSSHQAAAGITTHNRTRGANVVSVANYPSHRIIRGFDYQHHIPPIANAKASLSSAGRGHA